MPISGSQISQQIQFAYHQGQEALNDARAQIAAADQTLRSLADDREHTLADLARHYLPQLSSEAVQQISVDARQGIEAILLRQQDRITSLNRQVEAFESQFEEVETWVQNSTEKLDTALADQQRVSEQLAKRLAEDVQFKTLTQKAAEAEAALERAENSLEEIEHEATQKLPAYEQSKLFMYLQKQGMGTPTYTGRGVTRRMDRFVSRLIDYPKARQSYDYLRNTPQTLRNLIAQDRQALEVVMAELERQRDAVANELGMPTVVQRVEAADQDHDAALAKSQSVRVELDRLRHERTIAEDPQGSFYQEAIEHFKSILAARDQDALADRARQTPDPRDDQIVARLENVDDRMRGANTELTARQQRIAWLDQFLSEVGQLHQRFRAAGYDSANSQFDDSVDLTSELAIARDGRDSVENVWQRIRQRQRFGPTFIQSASTGLARAAQHPMTQVLVTAMAQAASEAMTGHARKAGDRYSKRRSSKSMVFGPTRHYPERRERD